MISSPCAVLTFQTSSSPKILRILSQFLYSLLSTDGRRTVIWALKLIYTFHISSSDLFKWMQQRVFRVLQSRFRSSSVIPKENMGGGGEGEGRSLAETPTWSVATVTTAMVAICFLVERSIYRFGKWLKKTKRKALLASLDKMREELMLLGIMSLMLTQTERKISEICVPSSLFTSRFYFCTDDDFDHVAGDSETSNQTMATGEVHRLLSTHTHDCGEGHEPFVSLEALEQLHRFLFTLGITHVIYSCVTVVLAMVKIYSWRKWEGQAYPAVSADRFQEKKIKIMRRQSTFVFQNASHPWSKSKILIWMLCFIRQFKGSITKSDYMALRLGFIANHKLHVSYNFHKYMVRSMEDEFHGSVGISWPLWIYAILCIFVNIHGVNIYFWLSFVPVILRHVVAQLALDAVGSTGPLVGNQLKPRDDLFWFGKPVILLWLIQFISFQNAFEMATFIWSLSELNVPSCFMKNHVMISIRIMSGIIVQFWCSYCTLPLNVIVSQMGSKFKRTLISESVRESLHSWCKRVRAKSRREHLRLTTTRSTCSLTDCEEDETTTVVSGGTGTLSPSFSLTSLEIEDASRTPTQDLTVFDISEQT